MPEGIYCAIDIGGTKTLVYLLNREGTILHKQRFSTPAGKGVAALVSTINRGVNGGLQEAGLEIENISGIGICIAALLDHDQGIIYKAPNLGWTRPVALKDQLTHFWKCPVLIENDANAAVLGEVCYGAARGHRHAIYITVSTGIGGGLYLNDRIYRGSNGFAGEIGHVKSFGTGRICGCGGRDCLETWASGKGIARSAGLLNERADDAKSVFALAARGDSKARQIIDRAAEDIALGLANLVAVLNPSCLILGGTVVAANPTFFEEISSLVRKKSVSTAVCITPLKIVPSKLEPEAGIWGIYALMLRELG